MLYDLNNKNLTAQQEEISLKQKEIMKKDFELQIMEKEAKNDLMTKSLEYAAITNRTVDPIFSEVQKLDAKIMYDKLQIDLSINEIASIKEQLARAQENNANEIAEKDKQLEIRQNSIALKEDEEKSLKEKEKSLREKLKGMQNELNKKEEYLKNLEMRLLKISNNLKLKTMLVCPEKILEWDSDSITEFTKLPNDYNKLLTEKDDDGKIEYLNKLNLNLVREKAKINSINLILKKKDNELDKKGSELMKIEDHFLDLVTYNGDTPVINKDQLKEVYEKFSKVGKIKERINKIFERLEHLKVLEKRLLEQKEMLNQREIELQNEIVAKNKDFHEQEGKIAAEKEKTYKEINNQQYIKQELEKKEKILQEQEAVIKKKLFDITKDNDDYNKLGFVDLPAYQAEYNRLIAEQKELKLQKEAFDKEKEDFFGTLKDLMNTAKYDNDKRAQILLHKQELDEKTKALKDKQNELAELIKKLQRLTDEDNKIRKNTKDTLDSIDELIKKNKDKAAHFDEWVQKELADMKKEKKHQAQIKKHLDEKEKYIQNKIRDLDDMILQLKKQLEILKLKGYADKDKLDNFNQKNTNNLNTELADLLAEEDRIKKVYEDLLDHHEKIVKKEKDLIDFRNNINKLIRKYNLMQYFTEKSTMRYLPCVFMYEDTTKENYYLYSRTRCLKLDSLYRELIDLDPFVYNERHVK